MKKLIAICVILGCLLTPLKGYSSYDDSYIDKQLGKLSDRIGHLEWERSQAEIEAADRARKEIIIGSLIGIGILSVIYSIIYFWNKHLNNFKEDEGDETSWIKKARKFYSTNAQLSPGQVFVKYQWYLLEISDFLIKYPSNKKFCNDLKSVFEMSQDDSRLTPKEKQEIIDKFAGSYKFLLPKKQINSNSLL